MPNILGGLMAGANFGTGFLQGQQIRQQNDAMNQMNQLALQNQQLELDQRQHQMATDQAISDYAMKKFNAFSPPPSRQPTGPAGMPGQPAQPAPEDMAAKFQDVAQFALGRGDLAKGGQYAIMAANLRDSAFKQQQTEAAIKAAELKRQMQSHAFVAQVLGAATNPTEFNAAKLQVLADPSVSPEEAKNISAMQYSPDLVARIRQTGMTSAQQARAQLEQMQFAEKQRMDQLELARKTAADREKVAHDRATEAAKKTGDKVGAASKAPSDNDIAETLPIIKQALGEAAAQVDPDTMKRLQGTIASQALQLAKANRALSYSQAVNIAVEQAQKSGQLNVKTTPDTHATIFGHDIPFTGSGGSTQVSFTDKGNTAAQPLPFTGQKPAELIPGKFYTTSHGVLQWDGKHWVRQ